MQFLITLGKRQQGGKFYEKEENNASFQMFSCKKIFYYKPNVKECNNAQKKALNYKIYKNKMKWEKEEFTMLDVHQRSLCLTN